MKKAFLTLILCTLVGISYAQEDVRGTVEGTVLTPQGAPATDALVRVMGTGRVLQVNESGEFSLENLSPGTHVIEASSQRWGSNLVAVDVPPGESTTLAVTVFMSSYRLDELVVLGGLTHSRSETVQPTHVINQDEILSSASTTLGATLDGLPGIATSYNGPGAGRPIIRGLGGNRISVLQHSMQVADVADSSPDHVPAVESLLADRIEIIRGPGTLLYGSSAVGGSVNIVDGRVPSMRPIRAIEGRIMATGGTAAEERTAAGKLTGAFGNLVWRVQGARRQTHDMSVPTHTPGEDHDDHDDEDHDDHDDHDEDHDEDDHDEDEDHDEDHEEEALPISVIENTFTTTNSGSFGLSWVGSSGYIGASVSLHGSEYGVPGHDHAGHDHGHHEEDHEEHEEETEEHAGVHIGLLSTTFDLQADWRLDHSRFSGFRFRAGYTDYGHDELEGDEVHSTYSNDQFEGRIELDHSLTSQTKGVIGAQVTVGTLETSGLEAFIPLSQTNRYGLFVLERYNAGKISIEAGGRLQYASIDSDVVSEARTFSGLSLSTGVNYKQSERLAVSLAVARSVKIPNATELFADGVHVGTSTYEIGNPDLGAESSISMDLSVHLSLDPVALSVTGFSNRFRDFIFLRSTDEEIEHLPVYRVSQGQARFQGFEAEADIELLSSDTQQLVVHLWSDYTQAALTENDEPLPRIPPLRIGGGLSYELGQLTATASLKRIDAQHRVATLEEETEGYTTLDASLRYRLFLGPTAHNFTLRGSNLTNTLGRVHSSFVKEMVPIMGRNIRLTYQLTF